MAFTDDLPHRFSHLFLFKNKIEFFILFILKGDNKMYNYFLLI